MSFNWDENYVTARQILGWSESEFWESNPRNLYATFFNYIDIQAKAQEIAIKPQALVGKDAFNALAQIAGQVR